MFPATIKSKNVKKYIVPHFHAVKIKLSAQSLSAPASQKKEVLHARSLKSGLRIMPRSFTLTGKRQYFAQEWQLDT